MMVGLWLVAGLVAWVVLSLPLAMAIGRAFRAGGSALHEPESTSGSLLAA